jgi:DNA-binding HxlR family transcriptional regulator
MSSKLEDVIRKKWSLSLLYLLDEEGELNFGTIQDELGISPSTLTQTKDLLTECGLIKKNEYKRTDYRYELTSRGEDFLEKIRELEIILESEDGD